MVFKRTAEQAAAKVAARRSASATRRVISPPSPCADIVIKLSPLYPEIHINSHPAAFATAAAVFFSSRMLFAKRTGADSSTCEKTLL